MKTLISLIFVFFLQSLTTIDKANNSQLAKVNKVNGIEVYILSEPLRKYEVVMGKGKSVPWLSVVSGGIVNDNIASKVSKYIKAVQKKALEENISFDAILYTNGKSVSAIKFTDKITEKNDRLAEVQKIDGISVFVLSEPLKKYTIKTGKGGGVKWKSLVTGGLANNSIEQDIQKYIGKFDKEIKSGEIDGLLYLRGKECNGIKF